LKGDNGRLLIECIKVREREGDNKGRMGERGLLQTKRL